MQAEIKTVCLASIFTGIISAVIPAGRLKNAFNGFCAVALVFYMISPLASVKAESLKAMDRNVEKSSEALSSEVRTAEVMIYENLLEKTLEDKLAQMNLSAGISVKCENSNSEIKINSIVVTGELTEEARTEIEKILTDSFSDVAVSFEVKENG